MEQKLYRLRCKVDYEEGMAPDQLDRVCQSIGLKFIEQMERQGWRYEGNTTLARRIGMPGLIKQLSIPWVEESDISNLVTRDMTVKTGMRSIIMEGLFSHSEIPVGLGPEGRNYNGD